MAESGLGDSVVLEHQGYIPVPKWLVGARLADDVSAGEDRQLFERLLSVVESIVHLESHRWANRLQREFEPFDPARQRLFAERKLEDTEQTEDRFLAGFQLLMERAGFVPLSQRELDTATAEDYLFTLPVDIDWPKLDGQMLGRFFADRPYRPDGRKAPEFAKRILIYHRGTGLDRTTGYLFLEKVDELIGRLFRSIGNWFVNFWKKDESKTTTSSSGAPARTRATHIFNRRQVERINFKRLKLGFREFLRPVTLQEPTFEELVLLFRFEPSEDGPPAQAIFIKTFRRIPMADLEVVFPAKRVSMKLADRLQLIGMAIAGVVLVAMKVVFSGEGGLFALFTALSIIGGYGLKVFLGYRNSKARYNQVVTAALYDKTGDNDTGVLLYVLDSLEGQEICEMMVAYHQLWRHGPLTEEALDARCERWLAAQFGIEVDFEVDDAVRKLREKKLLDRDNLDDPNNGLLSVVDPNEALERLHQLWSESFEESVPDAATW